MRLKPATIKLLSGLPNSAIGFPNPEVDQAIRTTCLRLLFASRKPSPTPPQLQAQGRDRCRTLRILRILDPGRSDGRRLVATYLAPCPTGNLRMAQRPVNRFWHASGVLLVPFTSSSSGRAWRAYACRHLHGVLLQHDGVLFYHAHWSERLSLKLSRPLFWLHWNIIRLSVVDGSGGMRRVSAATT